MGFERWTGRAGGSRKDILRVWFHPDPLLNSGTLPANDTNCHWICSSRIIISTPSHHHVQCQHSMPLPKTTRQAPDTLTSGFLSALFSSRPRKRQVPAWRKRSQTAARRAANPSTAPRRPTGRALATRRASSGRVRNCCYRRAPHNSPPKIREWTVHDSLLHHPPCVNEQQADSEGAEQQTRFGAPRCRAWARCCTTTGWRRKARLCGGHKGGRAN